MSDKKRMILLRALCDKETDRIAMQPWRPMQTVDDVPPTAAHIANNAIRRMIKSS